MIGRDWFEHFVPESDRPAALAAFRQLMSAGVGAVRHSEHAVRTREGGDRVMAWQHTVVPDETGDAAGMLNSGWDITARRGVEAERSRRATDAVAAAQYHYLSNSVGGAEVEYMYESDTKAWVHFCHPRWMYDGTALCGAPIEVSRGFLEGWYGHNGVSLGNPQIGRAHV